LIQSSGCSPQFPPTPVSVCLLAFPFPAATTGRAAVPFATSSRGPSPAKSAHQILYSSLGNNKEVFHRVHIRQSMDTSLAMSCVYDEKPPAEVSIDPSCSRNITDEDDDWVIVKKQRITVLIPPSSPDSDRPTISSKHSSLTQSKRDWDAARKKHPKLLIAEKSKDFLPENGNSERAQVDHSESRVQKDVPRMVGDRLPQSLSSPVVKSEWTEGGCHVVKGLFHQGNGKVTNFSGIMENPRMPVISSPVATKIMRARLLERRVARFGGIRNWLFDCGLGWFVGILDSEKLEMYQLVSLTMNQLKEMGLVAVGPRRKLIHAIDSLCHPCQVEMVS
ncbi:unnamed protein product, partial [Urochloa humidicola]